jgi:flagellum-specific peptidoglycan hydrolase FlgJ
MTLSTTPSFTSDDIINYRNLYSKILECNIKFPDVVFAQAVLETGHFRSKLFQNSNNLFGMKLPKKRETVALGKTKGGYAKFNSWESSVYDYSLWQNYILNNKGEVTRKEYLVILDKIYSDSKGYSSKVNKIINDHREILSN